MSESKARSLIKLAAVANDARTKMQGAFQDIDKYVAINPSDPVARQTPGTRKGERRYDFTAAHSSSILTNEIASNLFPEDQRWMKPVLPGVDERSVEVWMEDNASKMFDVLSNHGFYSRATQMVMAAVQYGTASFYADPLPRNEQGLFGGFRFETWPTRMYSFLEGDDGEAETVFLEYELTATQAESRFRGVFPFNGLGESMDAALKDGPKSHSERFKVLRVIRPRKPEEIKDAIGPMAMPWSSTYVAVKDHHVISEGGVEEQNFSIGRWDVNTDDNGWGRSPGMVAMPTIIQLNDDRRLSERAARKDIDPPFYADDKGVIGALSLEPAGAFYKKKDAEIGYLKTGGRFDSTQFQIDQKQDEVRQAFHTAAIEELLSRQRPNQTLGEFRDRRRMAFQIIGQNLRRLTREAIDPILARVFQRMLAQGGFGPPPQALIDAFQQGADLSLKVQYLGPLALAQRNSDIEAIERAVVFTQGVQEGTGQKVYRLNIDKAAEHTYQSMGVPADLIHSDEEVAEQMQADQEAQAEQAAIEQAQMLAQAAGSLPQQ